MTIFDERESNVRSYCRSFPDIFCSAKGSIIRSESGGEYIDFLSGAGALNYGHNNDYIKEKVISYLESDGIAHALDLYTSAKRQFLETFLEIVLAPSQLDYKVQFCGPTGTNAVEAALKLARKVKKRTGVFAFTGAYHGVSLGSLSVSGNVDSRAGAGLPLTNVTFMPYPHGFMASFDTIGYVEALLNDPYSGIEKPAAIIFETVQAEGGVIVAPVKWIQELQRVCDRHDILLICDDIQVGCGRTGPFFSFERANIVPDMVTLSKSISGYGFPMSLLLMKPELDVWKPGEHTGTFRGHQLSFVGATAALEYRRTAQLEKIVEARGEVISRFLHDEILPLRDGITVRGVGLIWGIDLSQCGGARFAKRVSQRCFERGLIAERVGRHDTVIKILPPLTIELPVLQKGCTILKQSIIDCLNECAFADAGSSPE